MSRILWQTLVVADTVSAEFLVTGATAFRRTANLFAEAAYASTVTEELSHQCSPKLDRKYASSTAHLADSPTTQSVVVVSRFTVPKRGDCAAEDLSPQAHLMDVRLANPDAHVAGSLRLEALACWRRAAVVRIVDVETVLKLRESNFRGDVNLLDDF